MKLFFSLRPLSAAVRLGGICWFASLLPPAACMRPSGKYSLAKPPFDPSNPNAVRGSVSGFRSLGGSLHASLIAGKKSPSSPPSSSIQGVKELVAEWCERENGERGGILHWHAYQYAALPFRDEALDRDATGMQLGCFGNVERIVVCADFDLPEEEENEERESNRRFELAEGKVHRLSEWVDMRLLERAGAGSRFEGEKEEDEGGVFFEAPVLNRFTRLLHSDTLTAGKASATTRCSAFSSSSTVMQIVQANWASETHVSRALNATMEHYGRWRNDENDDDLLSDVPRRIEVLCGASHPHVIKTIETYASSGALLDEYHSRYKSFLDAIAPHRAAVSPLKQAYIPLSYSMRPKLSREIPGTLETVPQMAASFNCALLSSPPDWEFFVLRGFRHFHLEVESDGGGGLRGDECALETIQRLRSSSIGSSVFITLSVKWGGDGGSGSRSGSALSSSKFCDLPQGSIDCMICAAKHWPGAEHLARKVGVVRYLGLWLDGGEESFLKILKLRPHFIKYAYDPGHQNLELLRFCRQEGILLMSDSLLGTPVWSSSSSSSSSQSAENPLNYRSVKGAQSFMRERSDSYSSGCAILAKWLLEQGFIVIWDTNIEDKLGGDSLALCYMPVTLAAGIAVEGGANAQEWAASAGKCMPQQLKGWSV